MRLRRSGEWEGHGRVVEEGCRNHFGVDLFDDLELRRRRIDGPEKAVGEGNVQILVKWIILSK